MHISQRHYVNWSRYTLTRRLHATWSHLNEAQEQAKLIDGDRNHDREQGWDGHCLVRGIRMNILGTGKVLYLDLDG